MNDEFTNFFIESLKKFKKVLPEKEIMEVVLDEYFPIKKLTTIGFVDEIDCEFKNDIFDEIVVDENDFIIDIRIYPTEPSQEEIDNLSQYWIKLIKKFNRYVKPCICIVEE